jgi:hypothetical protein
MVGDWKMGFVMTIAVTMTMTYVRIKTIDGAGGGLLIAFI